MAKLYFYYSAMNAGKSTTLLQSSYNYQERGMNTLLFTPLIDDRFQAGMIYSRIGLQSQAYPFDKGVDLYDYVQQFLLSHEPLHCVLVDEAQFLTKVQVMQLSNIADNFSIPVLAYGLRTDFRGEPFEGSQYLLAWADELSEIKTICHCGRKATMNIRIGENQQAVTSGNQIEIGGNDKYQSLCRKHFKQAHGIIPCTIKDTI
ncbi:MAG: thymidine kinase [Gammaproteobacteria bacterium RIFCSPLOWO2_02_FULL_38_11]|nr:MAG: thymidine kinase [Gammaproteobacteria bacterium RIFCSPLOWO2_02_FULL_38_11]